MRVFVVSHFHWDREWYRTMQAFRARLVDAIDQVLDLADADADFRFLLDGQTIVLDDYLLIRPDRRQSLTDHVKAGRLGIGPWFVQPDSLLPSGESLIRNLLLGRRAGEDFGPVSTVAYVPDSFGHPAQLPQLFAGFGLDGFVYWRGNGDEIDELGSRWRWRAPDGSSMRALYLTEGYFAATRPPDNVDEAVEGLAAMAHRLEEAGEEPVLLMNGFDHTRPDRGIAALVGPLGAELGAEVSRALLDDVVAACPTDLPEYEGELVAARTANLLAGVWSARLPLKIRNRRCESLLTHWAEPWAALGRMLGLPDERPALSEAWRSLVRNQAHDSICGCSIDAVHDRMAARYDDAEGLATETVNRVLERLAGRPADRDVPPVEDLRVAVFNPSPHPRTDLVRVALDAHPSLFLRLGAPEVHSLVTAGLADSGFLVDGEPARTIVSDDPTRVRWLPDQRAFDLEFVARDVPAFGCRTYRVEPVDPVPDEVDELGEIEAGDVRVAVEADGSLSVDMANRSWTGLFGVEDIGDRGDSYDFDPVGETLHPEPVSVKVTRHRHPSGVQRLSVVRVFRLPAALDDGRDQRTAETVDIRLSLDLVVAPGVPGMRARVRLDNTARDHRLRLRFPTGRPVDGFRAATTFDVAERTTEATDDSLWVHPVPPTFCHQGFVTVNGLTIVAPGLPEAEVGSDGIVALTLVRSVGWLARYDLSTRGMPAGPAMEAPGAQVIGPIECDITLLDDGDSTDARDAVSGLRGVIAGPNPMLDPHRSLLAVQTEGIVLEAVKPAENGDGLIIRLANPTDESRDARIETGFPIASAEAVRLDETPSEDQVESGARTVNVLIPPRALRTLRVTLG